MSYTSNQLRQSDGVLSKKPMNKQGEDLKINGNTSCEKKYYAVLSEEEHNKLIRLIRNALNDVIHDDKLKLMIETIINHCFQLFQKETSVDGSALWCKTHESNLWWIGGFRPSQLVQVIMSRLQHLCTHQQLSDIYNLGKSCQQAEDALAQGMVNLQKIHDQATIEGNEGFQQTCASQQLSFFKQADHLRKQFLHQFSRLFTISQQIEILLALGKHLHNMKPRSSL